MPLLSDQKIMDSNGNIISDKVVEGSNSKNNYKVIAGATILGISGVSALIAGLVTSHVAKKKNKELLAELKELGKEFPPPVALETAYSLALKALAWGTVWAVGGCSLIGFGIWKWYGFKDFEDFRTRMRTNVKKSIPTDERTEFENLSDFINYLTEISEKKKKDT